MGTNPFDFRSTILALLSDRTAAWKGGHSFCIVRSAPYPTRLECACVGLSNVCPREVPVSRYDVDYVPALCTHRDRTALARQCRAVPPPGSVLFS